MGFRLVRDVLGISATLKVSDRARFVAVTMAYHAKDSTGRYWLGHTYLAVPLGFADPTEPAARRAVTRVIRELIEAGVIEIEHESQRGRNRVYRFTHAPHSDGGATD